MASKKSLAEPGSLTSKNSSIQSTGSDEEEVLSDGSFNSVHLMEDTQL